MSKIETNNTWINIKIKKKFKDIPSEIKVDMNGNIYIDGDLYDKETSKYKSLSVDIEKHNKMNLGEETQKIIESQKKAKSGETVTIKDIKGPDRTESTTVQF